MQFSPPPPPSMPPYKHCPNFVCPPLINNRHSADGPPSPFFPFHSPSIHLFLFLFSSFLADPHDPLLEDPRARFSAISGPLGCTDKARMNGRGTWPSLPNFRRPQQHITFPFRSHHPLFPSIPPFSPNPPWHRVHRTDWHIPPFPPFIDLLSFHPMAHFPGISADHDDNPKNEFHISPSIHLAQFPHFCNILPHFFHHLTFFRFSPSIQSPKEFLILLAPKMRPLHSFFLLLVVPLLMVYASPIFDSEMPQQPRFYRALWSMNPKRSPSIGLSLAEYMADGSQGHEQFHFIPSRK